MGKKEFMRFMGIVIFVLFSGILVMAVHLVNIREINSSITESGLDVQRIKREMESMDREEIEKTIKEIEKEIKRLSSEI